MRSPKPFGRQFFTNPRVDPRSDLISNSAKRIEPILFATRRRRRIVKRPHQSYRCWCEGFGATLLRLRANDDEEQYGANTYEFIKTLGSLPADVYSDFIHHAISERMDRARFESGTVNFNLFTYSLSK